MTKIRLVIVWIIIMLGMLGLLANLFRIQVIYASVLRERADQQHMIRLNPSVPRRSIVDRMGNVLAVDKPVYTLYAHPVMFGQPKEKVAAVLAPILSMSSNDLFAKFSSGDTGIRVVDNLAEDVANQITDLQLDGLELDQEQQRLYPQQDLFSDVVGYVNVDRQGQAGLEYSQEKKLEQSREAMRISRSGDGSIIPAGLPKNFLKQDDLSLKLTLDSRLQRATQSALKQQITKYSAKRGAAIVMDVRDGSILSLAAEPSYDPNQYYKYHLDRLRDWVVTDLYEPGSTFKPINVAIALEAGAIHPDETFYDEGAIEVGGWPIQNSDYEARGGRGTITVTDILKYSSNVGMVHVVQRLQPGVFYGWLERLGLDKPTGVDLPFEASGQMKTYDQFTGAVIEAATTAFGQGFSLTPIKLIQLHATLANGGKMVTPHVVQGLFNADGQLAWQPTISAPKRIFSRQTTRSVLDMMEKVVQEGTGKPAQIPGYQIAGKTGTAQKASPNGGYIDRARITSFVGILPAEDPRFAVLAVVDEPQGDDAFGSTVAAPIVKSVMQALITTEQLTPSNPDQVEKRKVHSSGESDSPGKDTSNLSEMGVTQD
jgi:cell division protein FtsI (penicillin-binding protein 3)